MASTTSQGIPDQAFLALGYAIPVLARLIDLKCGVSLGSWLVLVEVKRRGKPTPAGTLLLRHELTRLFDDRGFTRPGVTRILNALSKQKLIVRSILTADERKNLFGCVGPRLAVVITPEGERKIEEFKTVLRSEFRRWRSLQPRVVRGALYALNLAAVKLLQAITKRNAAG
jgi:DNA-binding MarR family transcriptional regulator